MDAGTLTPAAEELPQDRAVVHEEKVCRVTLTIARSEDVIPSTDTPGVTSEPLVFKISTFSCNVVTTIQTQQVKRPNSKPEFSEVPAALKSLPFSCFYSLI